MGQITNGKAKKEVKEEIEDDDEGEEQEQDGLSVHSPCKINSSALRKVPIYLFTFVYCKCSI